MKRTSFILAALAWSGTAAGQDGTDLLRTPPPVSTFVASPAGERAPIADGTLYLGADEVQRLASAGPDVVVRLPSVERYLSTSDRPLEFRRIELFAEGAKLRLVSPTRTTAIQPPLRRYFVAGTPSEGIGIALDPKTGALSGFAARGTSRVTLGGTTATGIEVTAVAPPEDEINECGTVMGDQPESVRAEIAAGGFASLSETAQGAALSWEAVVAVDTDTEWMAGKGNNETTALNWITDIFLAMNVFFERDVETRLLIGDVVLRVGSDPYSVTSSRLAQLNEFGEYWRVNMSAIDRDFATLFSGRGTGTSSLGSGTFSGIAWVNEYCDKGSPPGPSGNTAGSYSYNAIGSTRTTAGTAQYVGHEIAHNLGSPHTHCYNPPVDQCYNAEVGCYSGTPVCPAGGKGTIMSYCHFPGPSGAGCGTSLTEFHPTTQTLLETRLAANSPACVASIGGPVEQVILGDGFEDP